MTGKQIKIFWPAFAAACRELGLSSKEETESYRKHIMKETAHAEHLKDVSPTKGFESLMLRVKIDAGDYEGANEFEKAGDRRIGAMIKDCTRQIFELSGKAGKAEDYVRGVIEQAGYVCAGVIAGEDWYFDYAGAPLPTILKILDTHRRRLLYRRERVTGVRLPVRFRLGTTYFTAAEA